MRQQIDALPRAAARSDQGAHGSHDLGDALPAPFGRMLPVLPPGPARTDHRGPSPLAPGAGDGLGGLVAHDLGIVADPAPGLLPSHADGPPVLGLAGLYGPGPLAAPHLYDPADRARLLPPPSGPGSGPRAELAALHATVVDEVRSEGLVFWPVVFSEARRRVVHGYQRRILDELLPRWVGRPLVDAVRRHGRRFYRPEGATFVPLELLAVAPWLAPTQVAAQPCPAPWTLPAGQAVARALDLAPLAPTDVGGDADTPLDEYVAAESRIVGGGRRLGPVGGRILAEVVIGVLELDVDSCLGPLPAGLSAGRTPRDAPAGRR